MKQYKMLLLLLTLSVYERAQAQTATVTWTTTHQTMDGFGGQDKNYANPGCNTTYNSGNCFFSFTSAQAAAFFSPSTGIGLSIIRTDNSGCPGTGACTVSSSIMYDIPTLQLAVANGAQVELTIAPPASMKYSGNLKTTLTGADGGCIDTSEMGPYASFIVSWIQTLQANNVPVSVVQPFNESDNRSGQCYLTAALYDTFVKTYLGPALSSAGLTTQLMITDDENPTDKYYETCLEDSACAPYVSIVSFHGYGSGRTDGMGSGYCCASAPATPANVGTKHIWMSEINGGFTYDSSYGIWTWDPSMADALVWARSIHDYLTTTQASGWEYWELADGESGLVSPGANDGLMLSDLATTSKRYYVVGQWSKFVRQGWVRIDTTASPVSGVYLTAFKASDNSAYAIVAVNQNSSSVDLSFSLDGFPSIASVTPTVTSENVNLADQSDVSVSGAAFSYSLPATSVVTFHGTFSSSSSKKSPAPPTALALTVQ
ncbi:MAG: glycoside hydrolase family 30 beta sandwich domain-containing protein [Candidatus Acidiferrum sp.]